MDMNMQVSMETTHSGGDVNEARELEATLLVRAAYMLKECQDTWGQANYLAQMNDALRFNQRLWTVFQTELASEESPLPLEVRGNLLNLSRFVDKRTFETMAQPAVDKLNVLIDINRNIAEGLAGEAMA